MKSYADHVICWQMWTQWRTCMLNVIVFTVCLLNAFSVIHTCDAIFYFQKYFSCHAASIIGNLENWIFWLYSTVSKRFQLLGPFHFFTHLEWKLESHKELPAPVTYFNILRTNNIVHVSFGLLSRSLWKRISVPEIWLTKHRTVNIPSSTDYL